jgi:hypothetical protein
MVERYNTAFALQRSGFNSRWVHLGGVCYNISSGPLAHLVEHFYGIEEVVGSSPIRSTHYGYLISNLDFIKSRVKMNVWLSNGRFILKSQLI